eukprot:45939_1
MKHLLSYLLGLVVLTSVVQSDNWFNWHYENIWGKVDSKDGVKFADRWGEGKKFWDLQFDQKFVAILNSVDNPVDVHVKNGEVQKSLQFRQAVVFDEFQHGDGKTIIVILQEVQDKYRIGFWILTAEPPTINGLKTWLESGDKQAEIQKAASLVAGVDGTKLAGLFTKGISSTPAKNEVTKPLNLDGRRRLMANEAIDNIIERMRRRRRLKTMEAIREVLRKEDLEF